MLFFGGTGLAGMAVARDAVELPRELRANVAGVSGGALCALAVALGDYDAVLKAIDVSKWPGNPNLLRESLDGECTLGLTFSTWHLRGAVPFCVLAFDCERHCPMLFSEISTPNVSVAAAVAAAGAWPGASPTLARLNDNVVSYCDVEFFLSPLDVFASLHPPRAVAFIGEQPSLRTMPGRLADHHSAFMAALPRPCVGFVSYVHGPHMLDSLLRRGSAAAVIGAREKSCHQHHHRVGRSLCFAVLLTIVLARLTRKVHFPPPQSRAAARRARKRKQRRWIWEMSQTPIRLEGGIERCVGKQTPAAVCNGIQVHRQLVWPGC